MTVRAGAHHDGTTEMVGGTQLCLPATVATPSPPRPAAAEAERLALDTLLRCWVRELDLPRPADGVLRIDLHGSGLRIEAHVDYWSATGLHRFGAPRLSPLPTQPVAPAAAPAAAPAGQRAVVPARGGGRGAAARLIGPRRSGRRPVAGSGSGAAANAGPAPQATPSPCGQALDVATVAALLTREAGSTRGPAVHAASASGDLVARVIDSTRQVAAHLAERRAELDARPVTGTPFLSAEQALLLGHPLHPTPKSRCGFTDAEASAYAPERRGSFALHWFAADRSVLSSESALECSAQEIVDGLSGGAIGHSRGGVPDGALLVPAHPWQARDLLHRPQVRTLIEAGLLTDLGPAGPAWYPTSSLRTVYRAGAPVMLKLSLGVRITNSRRENLRTELRRGVEMHRMLAAGLGRAIAAGAPSLRVLTDPAWLAVDGDAGPTGLDVMIRQNPFGRADNVACVAALTDLAGSLLAASLHRVAAARREPVRTTAAHWFEAYLRHLVLPVLWLDAEHGVALEAHQQNTLLDLDADGMPVGSWYRDNQGFYLRASRVGELAAYVPEPGAASASIADDALVTERLCYYLGINNLMGVVGALGHAGVADEADLLLRARCALGGFAADRAAAGRRHDVTEALLDAPELRCKANLLTRVDGLDELDGALATQSVYVRIANPLLAVTAR